MWNPHISPFFLVLFVQISSINHGERTYDKNNFHIWWKELWKTAQTDSDEK